MTHTDTMRGLVAEIDREAIAVREAFAAHDRRADDAAIRLRRVWETMSDRAQFEAYGHVIDCAGLETDPEDPTAWLSDTSVMAYVNQYYIGGLVEFARQNASI